MPVTLVVQFVSSVMIGAVVRSWGAAYWIDGTSRWMAARSSQVRVGNDPKPPCAPPAVVVPDITTSRFDPIAAYDFSTIALAPSPIATIAITAATPMMMPERGEERPQLVAHQRLAGDADRLQPGHAPPVRLRAGFVRVLLRLLLLALRDRLAPARCARLRAAACDRGGRGRPSC